tara:strand:+ start:1724 stop:2698 length:975 start_codon:yes stop_codon:yes gene_type:complete
MTNKISTLINLASPKLGSLGVKANDEFFAPLKRMLLDNEPIFIPDKYDDHGKWMDGWETKRRRVPGNDWCLIKLGSPGIIKEIDVNTKFFTGNYPPQASIEGIYSESEPDIDDKKWLTILEKVDLDGDKINKFGVKKKNIVNWIKVNIYPDGGIARLRLWGDVYQNWDNFDNNKIIEISALKNCGKIISYNNAHYGDVSALLSEGRGKNMGDGWETRRRREPGNDWIIIELGKKARLEEVEVDTAFFKGNFPESCSVEGVNAYGNIENIENLDWTPIISKTALKADTIHKIKIENKYKQTIFSHVRLNIFPDGGVSRFRVYGFI